MRSSISSHVVVRGAALLSMFILCSSSLPAHAAADSEQSARTVGTYRFLTTATVPDPFITSHFTSSVGVGMAGKVEIPLVIINEDTLSLSGDLLFALLAFGYQGAASERVGLRVYGNGSTRVGTGAESIISQGVNAITRFGAGTTVMLTKSESLQLSAVADMVFGNLITVDLIQFAQDIADGNIKNASLLQSDDGVLLSTGVRGAYAFNGWMGLVANLEVGYLNSVRKENWGTRLGAAFSADLGQKGSIPLGLQATVELDNMSIGTEGTTVSTYGGSAYYTGRDDFLLGVEMNILHIPSKDSVTINAGSFQIVTKYFF